jgi:hypothetical protein
MRKVFFLFLIFIFFFTLITDAFSYTVHVRSYKKRNGTIVRAHTRSSPNSAQIYRRSSAKRQFMRQTGYPKGRPGYVIDHIVPLKRGGADHPDNMQWQTKEEAREKDEVE